MTTSIADLLERLEGYLRGPDGEGGVFTFLLLQPDGLDQKRGTDEAFRLGEEAKDFET